METPCFAAFSWGGEKRRGGLLRKGLGPEERRAEGEASGCQDGRTRDKVHLQPLPCCPKHGCLTKLPVGTTPESGDLSASDWLAYSEALAKSLSLWFLFSHLENEEVGFGELSSTFQLRQSPRLALLSEQDRGAVALGMGGQSPGFHPTQALAVARGSFSNLPHSCPKCNLAPCIDSRFGFPVSPDVNRCVTVRNTPLIFSCLTCKARARAGLDDGICWDQQLQALPGARSLGPVTRRSPLWS